MRFRLVRRPYNAPLIPFRTTAWEQVPPSATLSAFAIYLEILIGVELIQRLCLPKNLSGMTRDHES